MTACALAAEIERHFGRVIVPLTDEEVAAAWEADPSLAERVTVSEHIDYRESADSDISEEDAMEKLCTKVMAWLGDLELGWIAWRRKPVAETQNDFLNDVTVYRASLRFSYKP